MPEAPLMYDITTDEMRPMTQADADRWQIYLNSIGMFLEGIDILRSAMRMVSAGEMEQSTFQRMLTDCKSVVGMRNGATPQMPKKAEG